MPMTGRLESAPRSAGDSAGKRLRPAWPRAVPGLAEDCEVVFIGRSSLASIGEYGYGRMRAARRSRCPCAPGESADQITAVHIVPTPCWSSFHRAARGALRKRDLSAGVPGISRLDVTILALVCPLASPVVELSGVCDTMQFWPAGGSHGPDQGGRAVRLAAVRPECADQVARASGRESLECRIYPC